MRKIKRSMVLMSIFILMFVSISNIYVGEVVNHSSVRFTYVESENHHLFSDSLAIESLEDISVGIDIDEKTHITSPDTSDHEQIAELSNNDETPFDGYTLFAPMASKNTYLINNDGEIVHTWKGNYWPGYSVYLLENGNLLHTDYLGPHPNIWSQGGAVEEIAPDGSVVWNYVYWNDNYLSHHDVEILPNGNILMICMEYKSYAETIMAGRNPDVLYPNRGLVVDYIIEVKPIGSDGGLIVWEWHLWDHLIQDYESNAQNYDVVGEHPELIDINFVDQEIPLDISERQLTHTNCIDYNEKFDQILLSIALFSEIWVIDHSTTTHGAAGHIGGRSGKGGDILYRWGNPQTYRAGDQDDQIFFGVHDAEWIESGCPGEGNILAFNNGMGRPNGYYSSVEEITPPVDINGHYSLTPDSPYGPDEQVWIYTADNPFDFYGDHISGAQRLPNGNTLICNGPSGLFFEVTPEKDIVWSYENTFPISSVNLVFKIRRYSPEYPGVKILLTPEKPSRPNGPIIAKTEKEYNYSSSFIDPQGDQIYYWFDWGDGNNSGWIGPRNSNETGEATHKWNETGIYKIEVKSKDTTGFESKWSKPLIVTVHNIKSYDKQLFHKFLENHFVKTIYQRILSIRTITG